MRDMGMLSVLARSACFTQRRWLAPRRRAPVEPAWSPFLPYRLPGINNVNGYETARLAYPGAPFPDFVFEPPATNPLPSPPAAATTRWVRTSRMLVALTNRGVYTIGFATAWRTANR
jgi:hypothetical protein